MIVKFKTRSVILSKILPKSELTPNFLAKKPSKKSVRYPKETTPNVAHRIFSRRK